MNTKNDIKEINLSELWKLFVQKVWLMIIAAAIVTISSFVIYKVIYVPEYTSTATMYILRTQSDSSSSSEASSDFNLALSVVNDCDYLIKSHTVIDQVMEELELDIEYEKFQKRITTNNPSQTRILEIAVTAETPEEAKRIADRLCVIGAENINLAMGVDQVNLYEYGTIDPEPSNRTGFSVFIIFGLIAAIAVYAIFLIIYILDDTIHTEEDIESALGLTVLGEIPDANFNGTKPGRYMTYGKAYGMPYGRPYGMPYGYTPKGNDTQKNNEQQTTDSSKK